MAKEVNEKEKKVKKESTKKETTKKDSAKKENKKSFFKEFKAELKRVSWPTFKQLVNNTAAVIAIVLVISAIVFVLDVIFESLNTYGVEKLKALVTSSSSENVEEVETDVVTDELTLDSGNEEVSNEAETPEDATEATDATETTDTTTTDDTTATTTEDEATTEQ